jgi:hypothetical protein
MIFIGQASLRRAVAGVDPAWTITTGSEIIKG